MEISEIRTAAPAEGRAAVELETFALLDRLHIPYAWVAHETADTIADCDVVSEVLGISAAGRSFTEPAGFMPSAFAYSFAVRAYSFSIFLRRMSGVCPTASATDS